MTVAELVFVVFIVIPALLFVAGVVIAGLVGLVQALRDAFGSNR